MAHFPFHLPIPGEFRTEWLEMHIRFTLSPHGTAHRRKGYCDLQLPKAFDYSKTEYREWLRRVMAEELRLQAKLILVPRLLHWAKLYGFKVNRVTIKDVVTRWGSCSSLGNINLSLWLMLVPTEYADYVMKHELAHLKEMNHSPRFWAVLDSMTDGRAKALRNGLRKYQEEHLMPSHSF